MSLGDYFYKVHEVEMGVIGALSDNRNHETPVAEHEVTVMEMDEFYKTEIGKKVLANPDDKKIKLDTVRDGYAIKRGDNYFLVHYHPADKPYINERLNIEKGCVVYPIEKDGRLNTDASIKAIITARFAYRKADGDIVFTPQPNITTELNTGRGLFPTNNDIFTKFVSYDPYWLGYFTHDASRQEVANEVAGESILNEKKLEINRRLVGQEIDKENREKGLATVAKINAFVHEC